MPVTVGVLIVGVVTTAGVGFSATGNVPIIEPDEPADVPEECVPLVEVVVVLVVVGFIVTTVGGTTGGTVGGTAGSVTFLITELPEAGLFFTSTVLVTSVASFPDASETLYVTIYVPIVFVSTGFTVTMLNVKSPSILSKAVAPASVYALPLYIDTGDVPVSVITGNVVSTMISLVSAILLGDEGRVESVLVLVAKSIILSDEIELTVKSEEFSALAPTVYVPDIVVPETLSNVTVAPVSKTTDIVEVTSNASSYVAVMFIEEVGPYFAFVVVEEND